MKRPRLFSVLGLTALVFFMGVAQEANAASFVFKYVCTNNGYHQYCVYIRDFTVHKPNKPHVTTTPPPPPIPLPCIPSKYVHCFVPPVPPHPVVTHKIIVIPSCHYTWAKGLICTYKVVRT